MIKPLAPRGDRKHILILGASGFVGRALFARLGAQRATPTYCRTPIEHGVQFDACTTRISDVLDNPEAYSHAVILLGDTKPDSCAANQGTSYAANVEGVLAVIEDLVSWQIKPILFSSEFVFDGTTGSYTEDDAVNPILTYGKQKVEVEHYLQERLDDYVILRLAKTYGRQRGDGSLFTQWLEQLERERTIVCANDQIFSPIAVDDVVEAIVRIIERDCRGLFHLCGPQGHSRLQLFEMLLQAVREHAPIDVQVIPKSIHDFPLRERRPLDVSMRPDKLVAATGIRLQAAQDVCHEIVEQAFRQATGSSAGFPQHVR